MAAGLGFKDFTTGEVLTAADVDGYLMQGIWVFASAAARDAAVTSPQEGNACYLKDTNQVLTYSGSAWVAVGGGSPLTTKGDLYGFSTVDARIPIGANNTVLTADSAQALGLKWATPAGASFVGCKAYKSANQSLSNATATMITFDSEFFDTDAIHSTSTNTSRFTVPAGKGGKWQLSTTLAYDANSTGFRQIRIVKNGTNFNNLIAVPVTADGTHMSHTDIFELVATDYIELQAYQNSGGNLNILSTNYTTFSFFYLGA